MHHPVRASRSRAARRLPLLATALTLSAALLTAVRPAPARADAPMTPAESVNPFLGTGGHGHTYPGASAPFGMVQLSPDTRVEGWDGCSGYHYSDSSIQGFSHTHLSGTGATNLGDVMLMPTVGVVRLNVGEVGKNDGYVSRFSHAHEMAKPGYYRVFLEDPKVTAELTATERCGFHRYTFPATDQAHIVIDMDHNIGNDTRDSAIKVEDNRTLSGFRTSNGWGGGRAVYFVAQFSRPFAGYGLQRNGERLPEGTKDAGGGKVKAFVSYTTTANEPVLVKVGISATSLEAARKNLQTEIPGWDFDAVHTQSTKRWNDALGSVLIDTPDPHIRTTFYSNLYESFLGPTLFGDADGTYRGMDHQVHTNPGFQNYTTFSLWDTFRAEHPLLTIVQPTRVPDMVNSLLTEYRELGRHMTPIWPLWGNETYCMIGTHSIPVIADAYLKGFKGFDAEAAYQAMRDTEMQTRDGLGSIQQRGYIASQPGMCATSKTIEDTVDFWSLAKMAESLGHKEDAAMFYKQAAVYRNHFDGTTRLMRGRKADGTWRRPFDTHGMVGDEYTEADAWQYAFAVQHDVPGMIALYGGDAGFVEKLDSLFVQDSTIHTGIPDITGLIGQFSQGDEQCHHVAYLYDYVGQPWKTQMRTREVMSTLYSEGPAGQCGNNDCGQMSAWYVMSAMGFYPVNPASGVYEIGSPNVSKAVLHLDKSVYGGHTFTVLAENNSPTNIYIQSATWDGKPYNKTYFTHEQLVAGGTLKLVMGPKPNEAWGSAMTSRPPATLAASYYGPLPTPSDDKPVVLKLPIRIVAGSDETIGDFISDPNMLDGATSADNNIHVDTSGVPNAAPAAVYSSERYAKDFTYSFPVPAGKAYTVRLHFAEIFDDQANMRVENIAINAKRVLTNFDIYTVAGGTNKAVVKEFDNILPDAKGNITIRISATPNSPDQNAKISAVEILPAN